MNASEHPRLRVSVDTNVLLRATLNEPGLENQSRAARLVLASGRWEVVVADLAITEYVHALEAHYRLERATICDLVSALIRPEHVVCDKSVITAALTHYAARPRLSFDDCFLVEYAQARRAVPLLTFDQEFAAQHPAAGLVNLGDESGAGSGGAAKASEA